MKLKYKWHSYADVYEYEIEVPDDIVFVYVDGDVGNMRHHGYNHYLGASKEMIDNNKPKMGVNIYKNFPDIILYAFDNVIFESEIKTISPEEFYEKFDFGNYYIFHYTRRYVMRNGDDKLEVIPSRLISITKILSIKSQNLINTFNCIVSSWIETCDSEVKGVNFSENNKLFKLVDDYFGTVEIKKDCEKEFTDAINQVLGLVNKKCT